VTAGRAERLEDDDVKLLAIGSTGQVAPIGGAEREAELELTETKQLVRGSRRRRRD
jgi:hypothetical protein